MNKNSDFVMLGWMEEMLTDDPYCGIEMGRREPGDQFGIELTTGMGRVYQGTGKTVREAIDDLMEQYYTD